MSITLAQYREDLITNAAVAGRPIQITYQCEKDGQEIEVRVIEIHDIQTTKAGDTILKAYCREREEMRTFRLDRILAHRVRRLVWRGPVPSFSPYLSSRVFGGNADKRPAEAPRRTAYSLLQDIYEGIEKAPALAVLRDAQAAGEPVALTYDSEPTGPIAGRVVEIVDVRKPTWNSGWFVTARCILLDETFIVRHKEITEVA